MSSFSKDRQYVKFCAYGFLKNLRFHDAFLLLFFLDNGVSFSQIGILYAVRELTINALEIPSGIVADTYGRRNSLVAAFLFYIGAFLLFYVSTHFGLLLFAVLLAGVGDAFRSGTHKGMIMDYLKLHDWSQYKVQYYGHTRSWSQRGSALSALFAGFIVLYTGNYRLIFLLSVIPYVLNFANVITYPRVLNFSAGGRKRQPGTSLLSVFRNFTWSLKMPGVFGVINSAALHSAYLKAVKDYVQPIMVRIAVLIPVLDTLDLKRKSGLIVGLIYFLIFLLTAQASRSASVLVQTNWRSLPKRTLLVGLFAGLACGVLVWWEYWVLALVAFILLFVIENLRKPILTGLLADAVSTNILTSVISAQSFYSTIVTSLLAIVLGVLADQWGIGIGLAVLSGTLFVLTLFLPRVQKHAVV